MVLAWRAVWEPAVWYASTWDGWDQSMNRWFRGLDRLRVRHCCRLQKNFASSVRLRELGDQSRDLTPRRGLVYDAEGIEVCSPSLLRAEGGENSSSLDS